MRRARRTRRREQRPFEWVRCVISKGVFLAAFFLFVCAFHSCHHLSPPHELLMLYSDTLTKWVLSNINSYPLYVRQWRGKSRSDIRRCLRDYTARPKDWRVRPEMGHRSLLTQYFLNPVSPSFPLLLACCVGTGILRRHRVSVVTAGEPSMRY